MPQSMFNMFSFKLNLCNLSKLLGGVFAAKLILHFYLSNRSLHKLHE